MYFNFRLFSIFATKAYQEVGDCEYSLEEVLSIFKYYFSKYEQTFNEIHPNIRIEQIKRIISEMPFIGDINSRVTLDVSPDDYFALIDKHFKTQYHNCDYNINHFSSGSIRLFRYYEELY